QEGERAFQRLRGMYAFCLVGVDGRTFLVRDPFGIKPLYYAEGPAGLAFASEPQAFAGARALVPEKAAELLALNYTVGEATAFTCGFDAPGAADERAGAERVARALDLDWRETSFGEEDFWRIAPLVAAALDDPTTDYAALPTYKLGEAAKGTLTVVLTGEGGDE